MDREFLQSYLEKSDFSKVQAEALSRILSELVTKDDFAAFRAEIRAELATMRAEMSGMEARLTWRIIAVVVFLGTVMTLVGAFID